MYRRRTAWVAAVVLLVLLYHFVSLRSDLDPPRLDTRPNTASSQSQASNEDGQTRPKAGSGSHDISKAHQEAESKPVCPPLPGMEDVLVVMKTGVTEAKDKVPVHFQTTLRCVPNYVIYSDFDEEIQGVQLHDALRNMDEGIKQSIPDFNIYNRIRSMGRAGLNSADFADVANSALGKPDNPGWKLDKWKFLPMVQETYARKPDAKWYVFMEADTYFSWGTLLAWLAQLNHNDPLYIGTETQIADVIFAHGGSGFIVSNPALKRVVNDYAARPAEIHAYTANHWAGDCVLGKILLDNGVPLTFSWPMLQNSHPGELDEFATVFYRKPWCFPAVAFHHLTPSDVQSLWEFEQKRFKDVRLFPCPCHILQSTDKTEPQNTPAALGRLPRTPVPRIRPGTKQLGQPVRRRALRLRRHLRRLPCAVRIRAHLHAVLVARKPLLHQQHAPTWAEQQGCQVWVDHAQNRRSVGCCSDLQEARFWLIYPSFISLLLLSSLDTVWDSLLGLGMGPG